MESKDYFGISIKTAHNRGTCVSCREATPKKSFTSPESLQEYKDIGLCQSCQDELDGPIGKKRILAKPAFGLAGPQYPLCNSVGVK